MRLKTTIISAGTAALFAAGIAVAQDSDHGGHDMMQGMNHDQMMQGMDSGGMHGSDQAQTQGSHDGHGADTANESGSPATDAYRASNLAMHEAMDIEFTGDADIDFARGMIGHHKGAIDMARIVLEHGEDPELRQLAEDVIEAQESEITFLQNWIAENAE